MERMIIFLARAREKPNLKFSAIRVIEEKDKPLFRNLCRRVISDAVEEEMQRINKNLSTVDPDLSKRLEAALYDNFSKDLHGNLISAMEKDFLEQEEILNCTPVQTYKVPS